MDKARLIAVLVLCNSCLWGVLSCAAGTPVNPRHDPGRLAVEPAVVLPAPLTLLDRVASDTRGYILGSNISMDLPQNQAPDSDGTLLFNPTNGGDVVLGNCAYGVYRIPLSEAGPLSWTPTWNIPAPAGMTFFAIANFTTNRWEWQRLDDPQAPVEFSDSAPYISSQDTVLITLLAIPGAGQPELDHFLLETKPAGGWRFVELLSELIPDATVQTAARISPAIVKGNPALLYAMRDKAGTYTTSLAVSSTALGLASTDWTTYTLQDAAPEIYAFQLAEIGGGYALLGISRTSGPDTASIHYHYSLDPSAGFSDKPVDSGNDVTGVRLGSINGMPGISYGRIEAPGDGSFPVYYAGSATVSGDSWTSTQLEGALISNAVIDSQADPQDLAGKPLLGFYNLQGGSAGFTVASASQAIPAANTDWTLLNLGGGSNNLQFSTMRDGHMVFATSELFAFTPNEIKVAVYEMTGIDPLNSVDWQSSNFDKIGLGQSPLVSVLGIGSELAFLHNSPENSNLLDGTLWPIRLWHSTSPGNTPADWQRDTVVADQQGGASPLLLVNGQPAFAQYFRMVEGYAADERTWTKLVWTIYVP